MDLWLAIFSADAVTISSPCRRRREFAEVGCRLAVATPDDEAVNGGGCTAFTAGDDSGALNRGLSTMLAVLRGNDGTNSGAT